jgi:hypothetical protein
MKKKMRLFPKLKKVNLRSRLGIILLAVFGSLVLVFGLFSFGLISQSIIQPNFSLNGIKIFSNEQSSFANKYSAEQIRKDAESVFSLCQGDRRWRYCYGDQIGKLVKQSNFSYALDVLKEVENLDAKTQDCHLISHKIASEEVAKDPERWFLMFEKVNQDICSGGFIHGALEGRMRFDSSFEITERTIPEICDVIKKYTGKENDDPCAHVLGHILLAEKYGSIDEAQAVCKNLPNRYKSSCLNGMFMENITRDNLAEHEIAGHIEINRESASKVEELCLKQSNITASESCWRELSHMYVTLAKWVPEDIYNFCQAAPNAKLIDECYIHSFNETAVAGSLSNEQMGGLCKPYLKDSKKMESCMGRVTRMMLTNSTKFMSRAVDFCGVFNTPEIKTTCFRRIGFTLDKIVKEAEHKKLCAYVPQEFENYCLKPNL